MKRIQFLDHYSSVSTFPLKKKISSLMLAIESKSVLQISKFRMIKRCSNEIIYVLKIIRSKIYLDVMNLRQWFDYSMD